jgi:hypothetical protein
MDESYKTQEWINTWQQQMFKSHSEFSLGAMAEIPLDVEMRVDAPDEQLATREGRRDAVLAMELAIQLFATELNLAFAEARTVVLEANVPWRRGTELFPWLSWPDRNVQVHLGLEGLSNAVDPSRPLTEQKVEIAGEPAISITLQSAIWLQTTATEPMRSTVYWLYGNRLARPLFTVELASLTVASATFEPGSVKAKLKAVLRIVVVAIPLIAAVLSAAATPQFKHWYEVGQVQQQIETQVAGQPCTLYANWKYDLETMQRYSLEAFNFEAPGLSQIERSERICNVQLATRIDQGSPDKIDGVWGPASQEALRYFAERHGLTPDIRSQALRGALQQVFRNREPK